MIEYLQRELKALAQRQSRKIKEKADSGLLEIDHYRLLFGNLCDTPQGNDETVRNQLDLLFNKALEIRQELSQTGANDLYLFLSGPPGSAMNPSLESLAYEVEQDERVCRKLVWLPDANGENVTGFLQRTFLARPWEHVRTGTPETLNRLLPAGDLPSEWMKILQETDLEGRELVEALVQGIGEDQ